MNNIYLVFLLIVCTLTVSAQDGKLTNQVYKESACGLKFIQKSTRVSDRRVEWVYKPMIPTPVSFNVSEFPATCFDVQKAYVWWVISDEGQQLTDPEVTLTTPDNKSYKIAAVQTGIDRSKGYMEDATRGFRADVTPYITGNGRYKIDVNSDDKETDGITLFIVYKDYKASPMFEGHIVLQDGFNTECGNNMAEVLTNINACDNSTSAQAIFLISDLQWLYKLYNWYDTLRTVDVVANGKKYTINRNFWNLELIKTNITKGTSAIQYQILEQNNVESDCYSWIMFGLYYTTNPCRVCPEELPITANKSEYTICWGDQIMLEASGGDSYEWNSIPAGFNSKQPKPVVSPKVNTKYIVKGVRGDNCIFGYDTINVNVLPQITTNIIRNVEICRGETDTIGGTASGGRPPYNYSWSPTNDLNAANIPNPLASPKNDTRYILTITDANGCQRFDTVNVKIIASKNTKITTFGERVFCPCDSTRLESESGFQSYLWSTGETTKSIWVKKTGKYYVTALNNNGCISYSDTVDITVYDTKTTLLIPNTSAEPGANVTIPVILQSSQYLNQCQLNQYYCLISFDMTVLVPDGNYQTNEIRDGRRYIGFNGTRGSSDTLAILNFMATLGRTEKTDIKLESFEWQECQVEKGSSNETTFTLDSLCKEGGITRLVFSTATMMKILPNPVSEDCNINFRLGSDSYIEIKITDLLGREIMTLKDGNFSKGNYSESFSIEDLTNGQYMIIMVTSDKTIVKMLEVIR